MPLLPFPQRAANIPSFEKPDCVPVDFLLAIKPLLFGTAHPIVQSVYTLLNLPGYCHAVVINYDEGCSGKNPLVG